MKGSVLEINQSKKYAGRTYIKWVAHEIYDSEMNYNKNGISWKESYVLNNLESIKGMPIAAEFLDSYEKDEPYGHGLTDIKDGQPLFEDSVVVGATEDAYIDTIEINGEQKKVLICQGYLYNQRYPKFVQWLKSKMYDGNVPDTSIEVSAKEGNDFIIYESGYKEKGRVPMEYDYSGSALLGIEPADNSAVLLELNNKKYKEENSMSEKDTKVISELNEKLEARINEINSLKNQVKDLTSAKESEVAELNQQLEAKTNELNEVIEAKTTELNSAIEELKEVKGKLEASESQAKEMETELNELREFKKEATDKELVAELNSKLGKYTDEEKEVAKEKIEACQKEPSSELIKEIVSEINSSIAQKIVEERSKQTKVVENNSADDIYSDVIEVNSSEEVSVEDLY